MTLARRVIAQGHQIHGAFPDQFLDHREGGRKGDLETGMDPMVDEQAGACIDDGTDQRAGEVIAAHMAVGGAWRKGKRGIGSGDPGGGQFHVEVAQTHLHGHAHAGTGFYFALDHVAMHVDHARQQEPTVAFNISVGNRALADIGNQPIGNSDRAALNDAIAEDDLEIRQPHGLPRRFGRQRPWC